MTVVKSLAWPMRVRLLFSLLSLAVVLTAALASAQPAAAPAPPPAASASPSAASSPQPAADQALEQKKQQAKEHFLKGLEFVQNESWDAALAEFLASRDLYPTRVALENAAVCLRQLKRYADALDMYNDLLQQFGKSLPPGKLKMVKSAIAKLQGDVGYIKLSADQPGSNVVVDGQERGKAPLSKPLVVNAGTHTVRVSKEGFETYEKQVLVAGRQTKAVVAHLTALRATGTLTIREASGEKLDVVVDGAVVGKTPWSGALAVGTHTVFLRGKKDVGTAPSSAVVKKDSSTALTLRAVKLDASIRIEPTPSNALVNIDGVSVGNGIWEGRLTSGRHRIEIAADGFIPYRHDVTVRAGQRELQRVSLDRDLSNPMWQAGFVPHIYVEVVGGAAWAPSFGGGADSLCSQQGGTCDRSRPLGFLAGARGGYEITKGLGLEVFLGALYMKEKMTRVVHLTSEFTSQHGPWTSDAAQDTTQLLGPAAAVSASYRFFDKTPLTLRVWAGVTRVRAIFGNSGYYTGPDSTGQSISTDVSVPEESPHVWMPFGGPEVRIGYRFSKHVSVDLGASLLVMLAPDTPRTGSAPIGSHSQSPGQRASLPNLTRNGKAVTVGELYLPSENGFGTFFTVMPTAAGRFDF